MTTKISIKHRLADTFHVDTYLVKQYEDTRVVDDVTVLSAPSAKAKQVLCYSPYLRANVLIPIGELKKI